MSARPPSCGCRFLPCLMPRNLCLTSDPACLHYPITRNGPIAGPYSDAILSWRGESHKLNSTRTIPSLKAPPGKNASRQHATKLARVRFPPDMEAGAGAQGMARTPRRSACSYRSAERRHSSGHALMGRTKGRRQSGSERSALRTAQRRESGQARESLN